MREGKKILDTPVNGDLEHAISSNWAYDHAADLVAHNTPPDIVMRTGQYIYPQGGSITTASINPNVLFGSLFPIVRAMTFDRIAIDVEVPASSGKLARLGIYGVGTNLAPGALLLDAGTVAIDSTGVKAITISRAFTSGLYFTALVCNEAFQMRCVVISAIPRIYYGLKETDFSYCYVTSYAASAYGALPNPFPAITIDASNAAIVAMRILTLD